VNEAEALEVPSEAEGGVPTKAIRVPTEVLSLL
jgi:hypothetical protein